MLVKFSRVEDPPRTEAPASPEVLFKEARRRRRRRRYAGIGALVVLAAVGGAVAQGVSGTRNPSPAPATETVSGPSSALLAMPPPCRASQLRPTFGTSGGAASQSKYVVPLTNTGARCELGGYPSLVGVKNGAEVPLMVQHGTWFGDLSQSAIGTGAQGQLWLATASACPALNTGNQRLDLANASGNTYPGVVITLPGGHGSLTVNGATLDVACGLSESQLGLPPSGAALPGTPDNLTVSAALPNGAPEHVATGVLHYSVRLFNGMTHAIPRLTCPDYRVTLTALSGTAEKPTRVLVREVKPLSCAHAFPIAPGATERLSLALRLPVVSSPTTVRFQWLIVIQGRRITGLVGGVGTFGGTKEVLNINPSR